MRFDEFCDKHHIHGNYRKAFYNHMMATLTNHDGDHQKILDMFKESYLKEEWSKVLDKIIAKFQTA